MVATRDRLTVLDPPNWDYLDCFWNQRLEEQAARLTADEKYGIVFGKDPQRGALVVEKNVESLAEFAADITDAKTLPHFFAT